MEIGVDRPALVACLARLDAAATAAGLPADRRAELLAEIRGHVDDALAGVGAPTGAALADVLDRLRKVTSASILPPLGEALFALALLGPIGSVLAGVSLATRGRIP